MPTKREREYYAMGYRDGIRASEAPFAEAPLSEQLRRSKPKRKLSAWNKYVKANANKPRFRYARSNKINLKKMAIAFRKTPAGRKKGR